MKYIIESTEDMIILAEWYGTGRISAEEYWEAVDEWSKEVVFQHIQVRKGFKHRSV